MFHSILIYVTKEVILLTLYDYLALFLVYAFLGWCTEVVYAAVTKGQIINRGFLNGPVCPIYGCGMVGVLLLLRPLSDNFIALFLSGLLLCSLIELIGGWALKQFFHTRWWDYSMRPLNIGGYVCLSFSIVWGLAVVFVVRLVQPTLLFGVELLPEHLPAPLVWALVIFAYLLFIADLTLTLITIIGLQKKLRELEKIAAALHDVSDEISQRLGKRAIAADNRMDELRADAQQRLDSEKADIQDGLAYLEEQKQRLEESIAVQRQRIAEASAENKRKAEAAIAEGRGELTESMTRRLEHMEQQKQELEARIAQVCHRASAKKAALSEKQSERDGLKKPDLAEWNNRLQALEKRRGELLKSISASPFGMRRLSGAFPALREVLHKHLPEQGSDSHPADTQD